MRQYFLVLVFIGFNLPNIIQGQSSSDQQSTLADPIKEKRQELRQHPLAELRHLDSGFPMQVPDSLDAWEQRRSRLKQDLLVSLGLWPMPPRTPLNAVIHGTMAMDGYSVSKVYFESMPGFFVTGNLYRPLGQPADGGSAEPRFPGVLCPHGHFRNGRFNDATEAEIEAELASGAESFASNARSILQARCVHLAKMGCVVFHYDMLGYADSQQIPYAVAHGFVQRRKQMEGEEKWGFFSPQAELRLQSIMGLQTWNSIRSLDFLTSLPDVDPQRLGVTGASGGGTQTFILGAIDDRPSVAFPAVMVSTEMQGGCTCENASHLRVSAGNVDFAALFAPRPLALTSANDWTRNFQTDGFPQLKAIYQLYDQPKNLQLTARLEFGHNYNSVGRRAMYEWFHRHLLLAGPLVEEQPLDFLSPDQLTVFNEQHPAPPGGEDFEAQLLSYWHEMTAKQLGISDSANSNEAVDSENQSISNPADEANTLDILKKGWQSIIAHPAGSLSWKKADPNQESEDLTNIWVQSSAHRLTTLARIIGGTSFDPKKIMVAVSLSGFRELDQQHWQPWLDEQWTIIIPDLLYCGDLSDPENPQGENRLVPNGRYAAGYTFGYNRTVLAWRATQLIDLCHLLISDAGCFPEKGEHLTLVADLGLEGLALLATSQLDSEPKSVHGPESQATLRTCLKLAIFGDSFCFGSIHEIEDPMFLPGSVRYGDLPGLMRLVSDCPILITIEAEDANKNREWDGISNNQIEYKPITREVDRWIHLFQWAN